MTSLFRFSSRCCRRLEVQYPHFPTEQEFTHSILSVGDLQQHSEGGKLCLLAKFSMEWCRLQCGGMLLPDLVEFYQWLHTNLSHLITYEQASKLTIGHVIKLAKQNSSKDYGSHLWDLYKRVEQHYNTYVELIGTAIGAGAYVRQGNKIFTIADDIPLLHFLSCEQDSVTLGNSHSQVGNSPMNRTVKGNTAKAGSQYIVCVTSQSHYFLMGLDVS